MLGISAFFTGSFQKAFEVQKKLDATQLQFVTSEVIRDKLMNLETVIEDNTSSDGDYVVLRNRTDNGNRPFSYLTKKEVNGSNRLVTKDFFVFNGLYDNTISTESPVKNPGGITKMGSSYFVVAPFENEIYTGTSIATCTTPFGLTIGKLDMPIDVTSNGIDTLFISNAGNGRILKIASGAIEEIATGLNFPTGLAYYEAAGNKYLFVSDTYNDLVKRIDLSDNSITTVAGEGDNPACNNGTAKLCKLDFPTGLAVDPENHQLYIVDSGTNRILRISDPSPKKNEVMDYSFDFTLDKNYKLEKIELEGEISGGAYDTGASSFIGTAGDYNNATKTFTSLTASAPDKVYDEGNCDIGGSYFYLEGSLNISSGDIIVVNNSPYTVTNYQGSALNCSIDPLVTDFHDKVFVTSATGIAPGASVYFSNPTGDNTFKLNGMQFTDDGFQEIAIKTFEVGDPVEKETDHFGLRIGDGVLGTPEDTIEVLVGAPYSGLNFPTGISLSGPKTARVIHFADSLNGWLKDSSGTTTPFTYFSRNDIGTFDTLSDFELFTDGGIDGLRFSKVNGGSILELTVNAKVNNDEYEQYTFNAKIN